VDERVYRAILNARGLETKGERAAIATNIKERTIYILYSDNLYRLSYRTSH
jgi:hypothetical protein